MRIYVANLAKYNDGHLVGLWIDLPTDTEHLQKQITSILGSDEEYAIHDYEAPFNIPEYSDPFQLNQIAELDSYDLARFAYLATEGYDWDYGLEHYDEVVFYEGMRLTDVASDLLEEGCFGEIPESIKYFIDIDLVANALSIDGYLETDKGTYFYR